MALDTQNYNNSLQQHRGVKKKILNINLFNYL
jgi:hypothetical protein